MAKTKTKSKISSKKDTIQKPKSISPFDIINMMFTRPKDFSALSNYELDKNFFMINRVLSIKYPLQGQWFNNLYINKPEVIKCWKAFMDKYEHTNRVPGFVYTKGAKKTTEDNIEEITIKKQDKIDYAQKYHLSLKDVDDIIKFKPKEFEEQIKLLDELRHFADTAIQMTKIKKEKQKEN